jgi:histone-lysine N-methyltransferase SETD7
MGCGAEVKHDQAQAAQKLQEWLTKMSDPSASLLEEMQSNLVFITEENEADEVVDEDEIVNVLKISYHDVDIAVPDASLSAGTVVFHNKDIFRGLFSSDMKKRIGTCHKKQKSSFLGTTGTWNSGLLEGLAVIENPYGGYEETYYRQGVKHGYSRNFGPQPKKNGNLWNVTLYKNGKMHGHFWQGCLGGGYITGVSDDNEMTGENIAYIFPNFKDALLGTFSKGKFFSGLEVELSDIKILYGMAEGSFTQYKKHPRVIRDCSSAYAIALNPLIPDRLEHDRVEVKLSNTPDSGEGLFAKVDFHEGDLVSVLNGVRLSPSIEDEWSDYKVNFSTELDLDVPEDMRRLDQYCATLAHKANHSFLPNTRWGRLDHPRFGLVVTIIAIKPILVGEELTVNYKYPVTLAPQWYKDCHEIFYKGNFVPKIY